MRIKKINHLRVKIAAKHRNIEANPQPACACSTSVSMMKSSRVNSFFGWLTVRILVVERLRSMRTVRIRQITRIVLGGNGCSMAYYGQGKALRTNLEKVIDFPYRKYLSGTFVQSWVVSHEEGKGMRKLLNLFLICVLGHALVPNLTEAAQQRVAIRLGGRYCNFHIFDLTESLKRVSGVIGVDFESMHGNVIVVMKAGKVNPDDLLAAIRQIKGDGYYCKGALNGEPGKVEYQWGRAWLNPSCWKIVLFNCFRDLKQPTIGVPWDSNSGTASNQTASASTTNLSKRNRTRLPGPHSHGHDDLPQSGWHPTGKHLHVWIGVQPLENRIGQSHIEPTDAYGVIAADCPLPPGRRIVSGTLRRHKNGPKRRVPIRLGWPL